VSIHDELGRKASLPEGPRAFEVTGGGAPAVFLGLGPDPAAAAELLAGVERVRWIECPEFEAQMPSGWAASIPAGWERAAPEAAAELLSEAGMVAEYVRNRRLFPSFWGPVLAAARLPRPPAPEAQSQEVWLPGSNRHLLHLDLAAAFQDAGLQVRGLPEDPDPAGVADMLRNERPRLFFSVNLRGLDPLGEVQHLLQRAGVRVAVWCVDNPFHLLSAVKTRAWSRVEFYVTDDWFIEPLRRRGVDTAVHLPLAAGRSMTEAAPGAGGEYFADRLVFAGRSRFPGKRDFFAGCRLKEEPWREARAMLARGERPDFAWWRGRLGVEGLWPGAEVRLAGYGAEESTLAWRSLCLDRAAAVPLTVFGDDGWREAVDERADLRGAVDYHEELPGIYAAAGAVLNVTSLLLPRGLTNRHFDAPAAGGLALTDATPGLSIFPEELVREVRFQRAEQIPALFERIMAEPGLRQDLAKAWRTEVLQHHEYASRITRVLG
jgi:hypothetical protein